MEPKQILIRILSKFGREGVDAAKRAMTETVNQARQVTAELAKAGQVELGGVGTGLGARSVKEVRAAIAEHNRLLRLTGKLDKELAKGPAMAEKAYEKFRRGLEKTSSSLKQTGTIAARTSNIFGNLGQSLGNARSGFGHLASSIFGAINPLNLFDNIFGRVTIGLAVWQAWRMVKHGFEAIADATVNANSKMQSALGAFTAFSGGSEESAKTFIAILKDLALQTGVAFDTLLDNAKALPTKVGQNFQAFSDIAKTAIALGFLDPAQGVEGAFFALRNALEGGAQGLRSLVQRFEIGTVADFNKALEETGDVLSALQKMLKDTGLDVDSFIASQRDIFPVVVSGIQNSIREFLRVATSGVFNMITSDLARLRDWFLANQVAIEALATVIGQKLVVAYQKFKAFVAEVFLGGADLTPQGLFEAFVDGLNWFIGRLEVAASFIINTFIRIAEAIASFVDFIASIFGVGGGGAAKEVERGTREIGEAAVRGVTDSVKQGGKAAKEAAKEVVEAIPEALAVSVDQISSALTGITEGGKETIKRFVEGMVEGIDAENMAKIRDAVLDNVIDLEAQELAQEKAIDKLEDWVEEAAREVERARERLKIFDIENADIPERFTRARRRQLEMEQLAAEREQQRRKNALDAAKEQLQVTKEQLAAQREVLSLLEQAFKEAEKEGRGIFTGFTEPPIDVAAYEAKIKELAAIFEQRLGPTFTRLREDFEKLASFIRGLAGAEGTGVFAEMYDKGSRLAEAIGRITGGLGGMLSGFDQLIAGMSTSWASADPGLRKLLLVALGVIALKNIGAITASIKLIWSLGGVLTNMTAATAAGLIALITGTGTVTVGALALPITILIAEVWLGRHELAKWFSGERPLELVAVLKVIGAEVLNQLLALFGQEPIQVEVGGQAVDTEQLNIWDAIGAGLAGAAEGTIFETIGNKIDELLGGIKSTLSGSEPGVKEAAETGIAKPILDTATDIQNQLVGNSIFPDTMQAILQLFRRLPGDLQPELALLKSTILGEMASIRDQWIADWDAMLTATVNAVQQINLAQAQLQTSAANNVAESAAPTTTNQTGLLDRIRIELDAQETRRMMQDGVAEGMIAVGSSVRNARPRGRYR